jgi:hypothetical protein
MGPHDISDCVNGVTGVTCGLPTNALASPLGTMDCAETPGRTPQVRLQPFMRGIVEEGLRVTTPISPRKLVGVASLIPRARRCEDAELLPAVRRLPDRRPGRRLDRHLRAYTLQRLRIRAGPLPAAAQPPDARARHLSDVRIVDGYRGGATGWVTAVSGASCTRTGRPSAIDRHSTGTVSAPAGSGARPSSGSCSGAVPRGPIPPPVAHHTDQRRDPQIKPAHESPPSVA